MIHPHRGFSMNRGRRSVVTLIGLMESRLIDDYCPTRIYALDSDFLHNLKV